MIPILIEKGAAILLSIFISVFNQIATDLNKRVASLGEQIKSLKIKLKINNPQNAYLPLSLLSGTMYPEGGIFIES